MAVGRGYPGGGIIALGGAQWAAWWGGFGGGEGAEAAVGEWSAIYG
jgi:hypothetical protein